MFSLAFMCNKLACGIRGKRVYAQLLGVAPVIRHSSFNEDQKVLN